MSSDHEATLPPGNSDEVVRDVIATRFSPLDTNLGTEQLVDTLLGEIPLGDTTRVVALYGGAASGKSTLSRKLIESLISSGHTADVLGTDDYVIGDRAYRREHYEGKEPRAKYDFNLLNEKIETICALKEDETTGVPTYDEETGEAIAVGEGNYVHLVGKVDVLFVEGDFPEVEDPDLTIFLHVADDQRLQDRIDRDAAQRSEADNEKVIENFNQRQQTQHFPITLSALEHADLLIEGRSENGERYFDLYRTNVNSPAQ